MEYNTIAKIPSLYSVPEYKGLIDDICKLNHYILDFQATHEAQAMFRSVYRIVKGHVHHFSELKESIQILINIIEQEVELNKNDETMLNYLEMLLEPLVQSKTKLEKY
jgi:hypothetical protein